MKNILQNLSHQHIKQPAHLTLALSLISPQEHQNVCGTDNSHITNYARHPYGII